MALVSCPDCGRQLSTAAVNCPQCNRPMALAGAAAALATAATATTTAGAPLAEHVLWEGVPSLKAMMLEIVVTALYAVVLPIAAVLAFDRVLAVIAGLGADSAAFVASNRPTLKQAVTALVVIVVVVRVAKLAWHAAVLRSHHYRVSNHRIVVESGVLSKRIDEVDMRTVEDIEFRQMPMQRLFGIGDIAIVSADKQMARFRLVGVEKPRDLRELIRSSAFQATRGQLFTRTT